MNDSFHLIDLVSQAIAVQSLLRGKPAEDKIRWLSLQGTLTPKPKTRPDERQTFWFETPTGHSCAFFMDGDQFVFFGDHTTFTAKDSDESA